MQPHMHRDYNHHFAGFQCIYLFFRMRARVWYLCGLMCVRFSLFSNGIFLIGTVLRIKSGITQNNDAGAEVMNRTSRSPNNIAHWHTHFAHFAIRVRRECACDKAFLILLLLQRAAAAYDDDDVRCASVKKRRAFFQTQHMQNSAATYETHGNSHITRALSSRARGWLSGNFNDLASVCVCVYVRQQAAAPAADAMTDYM